MDQQSGMFNRNTPLKSGEVPSSFSASASKRVLTRWPTKHRNTYLVCNVRRGFLSYGFISRTTVVINAGFWTSEFSSTFFAGFFRYLFVFVFDFFVVDTVCKILSPNPIFAAK
ncbi:hypothetical protein AHF37_12055, partial [Paragonimus kellicotti]